MSKAFIETTILADVLLKPGSTKQTTAKFALSQYSATVLPVYAIKEWKAGPLDHYSYFHDKLVTTRSLADTISALVNLAFSPYKKSTSFEAFAAAAQMDRNTPADITPTSATNDGEMADRYRLATASLIIRSWRRRRRLTTETVQDLTCYTESEPRIGRDGLFDLEPKKCDPDGECCLAQPLKAQPKLLRALRDAIPETSARAEDRRRRKALKQLINTPKIPLTRELCRDLGDVIFAFFCPEDAVVLTTNIKDHRPLAQSIGKEACSPRELKANELNPPPEQQSH